MQAERSSRRPVVNWTRQRRGSAWERPRSHLSVASGEEDGCRVGNPACRVHVMWPKSGPPGPRTDTPAVLRGHLARARTHRR